MSTITSLASGDNGAVSRTVINTNFTNLDTDKIETSYIDTDTTLAANSDLKLSTQKAIKAYVDGLVGGTASTSGVSAGPTTSSTQTITHSLGRTPRTIRIHGLGGFTSSASANQGSRSYGTYNATGNRCVYMAAGTGSPLNPATSTTFAVRLASADTGGSENVLATGIIQNVTSTTFDIVWTTNSGDSQYTAFHWETN